MLDYALSHAALYLLVLLRVVAFIGASPIVSLRIWPTTAKLGLAGFVALLVTPTLPATVPNPFDNPGQYIVDAVLESATGLFLGFIATMIFSALSIAGQMVDVQIGFATAQLFDPSSSQSSTLIATLQTTLFTLYFLGVNGLDGFMLAIMRSYSYVPVGDFRLHVGTWQVLVHLLAMVMVLAVQIAAPVLAALLLTDVTLAFVSRAVPQMNVYVVGMPAKLFVGLTLFAIIMPGIVSLFGTVFNDMFTQMAALLQFIGG